MKKLKHTDITVNTYRGPRTNFRLQVVVSNNGTYGKNYLEAAIYVENGNMFYYLTDGFEVSMKKPIRNNLKSAINIVEYYLLEGVLK